MLQERIDAWRKVYGFKLAESIRRHPTQYHNHDADEITTKCHNSLTTKGLRAININAHGWKSAAKHFGIANTYSAWESWFKGQLTPEPIDKEPVAKNGI